MNLYIAVPCLLFEIFIIYNYWFSLLTPRFEKKKVVTIFFIAHILNVIKCILMFDQVLLKAITTSILFLALINFLYNDAWYKKLVVYVVSVGSAQPVFQPESFHAPLDALSLSVVSITPQQ